MCQHLEVFISVACNLSVDLVSTRPPFVYSWLKIFINDLVEFVPACTWFGWLLHISFTCQSPLIYIPSPLLLPSKNGATGLSSKSSDWINYSKMRWYVSGRLLDRRHSYNPPSPTVCRAIQKREGPGEIGLLLPLHPEHYFFQCHSKMQDRAFDLWSSLCQLKTLKQSESFSTCSPELNFFVIWV